MSKFKNLLFLATILLLHSCANVYLSPDAKSIVKKHTIIAIAPPKVTIAAQRKVDAAAIASQEKTESINFQKEMYSWLLRRKGQNKIQVEVLDVETTNAKLTKAGYFDGTALTPNETCELLGVDAVITSNYSLVKPISEGAAAAFLVIAGVWTTTNSTAVTMELHDKANKKLLWNYNHKVSGSVGSTPAMLVDRLMRNASKKMPYTKDYNGPNY